MDKQAEQARELLVKQHQEEDLRQDAMRSRSEEELHHSKDSRVKTFVKCSLPYRIHPNLELGSLLIL